MIGVNRERYALTATGGDAPTEGNERYDSLFDDVDHLLDEFPPHARVAP